MFIASTYAYLTTLYLTTDLFLNVYMSSKAKKNQFLIVENEWNFYFWNPTKKGPF